MLAALGDGGLLAQTVPADDPVAAAQIAMMQIEQLRCVSANDVPRVLDLLKRGADAVARGRQRFADAPANAPSKVPVGRKPATAPANLGNRLARCHLDFLEAELRRRAALALPADHPQRAAQFQQALSGYKALRVEYRELAVARLGYAGEARVLRAMDDLAGAEQALASVTMEVDNKGGTKPSATVLQVQRVLWLERVITTMARKQADGEAMAARLRTSALMKEANPAELAALQWARVEGAANACLAGGAFNPGVIAGQAREANLVQIVPEHERLLVLVKLNQQRHIPLLPIESLHWARLQAWASMKQPAAERYGAAIAGDASLLTPTDWQTYGLVLRELGKEASAADAMERGLAKLTPGSGEYLGLLRAIAASRLSAAREAGADDAKRTTAISALWRLAEASNDRAVKLDALRSWAHLAKQTGAFEKNLAGLMKYRELVEGDPYLYFMVADTQWRATQLSGAATKPATQAVADVGKEIGGKLSVMMEKADEGLKPSFVLLMANIVATTPGGGARAALDVLARYEAGLKADAAAMPQLLGFKMQLLMELGLTNEAEALAAKLGPSALSAPAALKLAALLAGRYPQISDPSQRGALRERVSQLMTRALSQQQGGNSYREAVLDAARVLISVEAYADAQTILGGVQSNGGSDPRLEMLLAKALQGQGKIANAQAILAAAAASHPDDGDVQLATGQLQQQLQQWEAATNAYRLARKQLDPGGETWWQATLGLADCMIQEGHAPGAQELLRVASAMYRSSAPAGMLGRIDEMVKQSGAPGRSQDTKKG
jgi:tetratricopeptide (TPR) repeat protein